MSDISHDLENIREKERQGNLADMDKHLRREPKLSVEYSRIAGTRVYMFFDNAIKKYVLKFKWNGKYSQMWVGADNSTERNKVREHFKRLRNGVAPRDKYKDAWDWVEKNAQNEQKVANEFAKYRGKEDADMIDYYLFDRGKRSVVIERGEK